MLHPPPLLHKRSSPECQLSLSCRSQKIKTRRLSHLSCNFTFSAFFFFCFSFLVATEHRRQHQWLHFEACQGSAHAHKHTHNPELKHLLSPVSKTKANLPCKQTANIWNEKAPEPESNVRGRNSVYTGNFSLKKQVVKKNEKSILRRGQPKEEDFLFWISHQTLEKFFSLFFYSEHLLLRTETLLPACERFYRYTFS